MSWVPASLELDATYVTPVIRQALRNLASTPNTDMLTTSFSPRTGIPMKAATATAKSAPTKRPQIRIAVVESDPLRFVGFRALFDSEPDFELISANLPDIAVMQDVDLVLLGNRNGQNLFDVMASLKATRPDPRIIVTRAGMDEETTLKVIASGSKGYVDEAASASEFVQAIRIVSQGSDW